MPTDLPDLAHQWRAAEVDPHGIRWECHDCLLSSRVAFDALCPDRVKVALAAAEARGREQVRGRVREALGELAHARNEAAAYAREADESWAGHALGLAVAIETIDAALSGEEAP